MTSVRTLATMVQMPLFRDSSSPILSPSHQGTNPRKELAVQSLLSKIEFLVVLPLSPSAAETEAIGMRVSAEMIVIIAKSFLNRVFILDNFFNLYIIITYKAGKAKKI